MFPRRIKHLEAVALRHGWTAETFQRLLRFYGTASLYDLLDHQYEEYLRIAASTGWVRIFQAKGPLGDGKRMERLWHLDLSDEDFYAAWCFSLMDDDALIEYTAALYLEPVRMELAWREVRYRLRGLRLEIHNLKTAVLEDAL